MKLFFKILAIILLVGYLVASVVLWGNKSDDVVCERFYISVCDSAECDLITSEKLYHYLRRNHLLPEGKRCGDIDPAAIERSVRSIDLLGRVECYYESNGDVYLLVDQRRPVMRVMPGEGDTYYLDKNGERIAVDTMYVEDVPIVMGNVYDKLLSPMLIPLVEYIVSHEFWSHQITQIYITQQHEVMLSPRVGNHKILLGSLDNYQQKLQSVLEMYRQVMPKVGWNAYDTISVKYKNQVVCTRRDKKYRHNTWTKKTLSTYE